MSAELASALAGAGGGVTALLTTYPLLTVTTVQQTLLASSARDDDASESTSRKPSDSTGSSSASLLTKRRLVHDSTSSPAEPPPPKTPVTALEVARKLVATNGVGALYNGVVPALVGTATSQAVYYATMSRLRRLLLSSQNKPADAPISVASTLLVASAAGCVNVMLTNPIWVVVTIMQAQRKSSDATDATSRTATTLEVIRDIYRGGGLSGYWKGVVASLIMVSNPTIQYAFYEGLLNLRRRYWATPRPSKSGPSTPSKPGPLEVFLLGMVAKFGATVITYPLLVVKSRLQSTTKKSDANGSAKEDGKYRSTLEALVSISRDEGVGALYRGIETKLVQTLTAAGLLFMVADSINAEARRLLKVKT
ncbi:peroxisomal adenine nucleotide transporter [Pycnococcus provasolii]